MVSLKRKTFSQDALSDVSSDLVSVTNYSCLHSWDQKLKVSWVEYNLESCVSDGGLFIYSPPNVIRRCTLLITTGLRPSTWRTSHNLLTSRKASYDEEHTLFNCNISICRCLSTEYILFFQWRRGKSRVFYSWFPMFPSEKKRSIRKMSSDYACNSKMSLKRQQMSKWHENSFSWMRAILVFCHISSFLV